MASILVATGFVRIDSDTAPATKALKAFGSIGASALSTTLIPALSAVAVGFGSVAAAAGVAAGAAAVYGVAVNQQFSQIKDTMAKQTKATDAQTKATDAQTIAQRLAKEGGFTYGQQVKITADMTDQARQRAENYNSALSAAKSSTKSATEAQQAYKTQLASMPKATQATAEALQNLKSSAKSWSDSLAGTTMPLFTRGIQFLEKLLPKLTPVVRDVAHELDSFVNSLRMGVAGQVFQQFGDNIKTNGAGALRSFLDVAKNLTVGILGLLNTFMPASTEMTGGLVKLTEKFALWGATSQNSDGVRTMLEQARQAAPAFGVFAKAIGEVVSAAGPLGGVGLKVLTIFAQLIDAIPTPVLRLLVPAIIAVNLAMKAYAIYQAAATAATWLFTTSVTASTGTVYTSRAVMIAHRIILLGHAVATAASTAATWLWTAATTAATFAMRLARLGLLAFRYALVVVRLAVVLTTTAFRLLAIAIISNPIGLLVAALVLLGVAFVVLWKKSETFRNIVKGAWEGIKVAAQAVANWFTGPFLKFFQAVWDKLYTYWLKPIIWYWTEAVPTAAKFLWKMVVAYFTFMVNAVKAAWDLYYKLIIKPFLWFYTQAIPAAAKFLWKGVTGFFTLLFSGIQITWGLIKKLVINPLITFFTVNIPNGARNAKNRVVEAWNALYGGVLGAYKSVRNNIFSPIGTFFTKTIPGWGRTMKDRVVGFFREMRDGIGTIWSGIQSRTKAPINWVLKYVWNQGIVGVWKKITGWIGIPNKLGTVKLLAAGGTVGNQPMGVFNRPTAIVGEGNPAHPEYVIPTDPKYATRARALWQAAGAHFMEDGGILGGIGNAVMNAAGKVASTAKDAVSFFVDPYGKSKGLLNGPLGKLKSLGSSPWAQMASKLPRMAVDGLLKAVKSVGNDLLGSAGLGSSGNGGSGVARWKGVVQMMLRMLGQPAAYTDLTLRRMNQESGGNPNIVNKWDSNWKAGHPSVGLMQVIGPTFRSYAGKYRNTGPFLYGTSINPAANIYSSMRYALAAYGSLPRAYNRAGGYANGTAGTAGGMHLFGERGPEWGFSPAGWRILNARRSAGLGGGGGMLVERLVVENHGVIGSQREVEDWLVRSIDSLRKKRRL